MSSEPSTGGTEQIAERIREFAEWVDSPDDWMIVVPSEDYDDVLESLETTTDAGRYHQGISLCYGDGYDETQVRLKRGLADQLRSVDTATDGNGGET
ncbi:hypothetical protein [Halostella litorea]|uniref:hypothetical protein n=1 Tax=Halostella litorea TaxID=2528831 RepID=UPI0010927E3E|nr:hypothetical protein [Halostella litorea]